MLDKVNKRCYNVITKKEREETKMKISEMIAKLQELEAVHGDVKVGRLEGEEYGEFRTFEDEDIEFCEVGEYAEFAILEKVILI